MTITLESIKAAQNHICDMIAKFEAQAVTEYSIPEQEIELAAGEHYAGIILDEAGEPAYHLILLPGEKESINWKDAMDWAKEQGGNLPTRPEQALLFANLKSHFEPKWYWSSERQGSDSGCAWFQGFLYGYQTVGSVHDELRARAVRRLVIQ